MLPSKANARTIGFFYLLVVLIAPFRLIYIPSKLFVSDNAAATIGNIANHELLFRLGLLSDLFVAAISLVLTYLLFLFFKNVDRRWALLMLLLGFMDTPGYFFNVINDVAALMLSKAPAFMASFSKDQLISLSYFFIRLHGEMISAAELFWGIWLFPLAILVMKSRLLPRVLGIWLFVNGIAYLALSVSGLAFPEHEDLVSSIAFPAQLGEVAFVLWLVVMGVREGKAGIVSANTA
jgi:hypothetical protein